MTSRLQTSAPEPSPTSRGWNGPAMFTVLVIASAPTLSVVGQERSTDGISGNFHTVPVNEVGLSPFALDECRNTASACASGILSEVDTDWSELHVQTAVRAGYVRYAQGSDASGEGAIGDSGRAPLLVIDTFSDGVTVPAEYELIGVQQSQIMMAARRDDRSHEWDSVATLRAVMSGEVPQAKLVHNSLPVHRRASLYILSELTGMPAHEIAAALQKHSVGAMGYNDMAGAVSEDYGDVAFAVRPSQLDAELAPTAELTMAPLLANGNPVLVRTAVFGLTDRWSDAVSTLRDLAEASAEIR